MVSRKQDVLSFPLTVWYVSYSDGLFYPEALEVAEYGTATDGTLTKVYCEDWGWLSVYSVYETQEDAKKAADDYNYERKLEFCYE